MKKVFLLTFLLSFTFTVKAQSFLSLDSCRALALANNKDLLISNEKISAAHYQRKAAFTNYLPNFSATGAYMRNQKEFSLLNNDQKAALSGLGTNLAGPIQQAATEIATAHPDLAPLISSLSGKLGAVLPALDQAGNSLVDALRTDTRNIYAGAITLTQPLYMGGKIRAYNKITKYAEELAQEQHHGGMQEVIMSTDQAYWQVISLVNKKKLAEGYLKLLQQLDSDVEKMINEGVATKADGLSVRVKVNEAEMTLTKVEDGLSLARMLLCQLCGIDLSSPITLADENMEDIPLLTTDPHFDLSTAYENRPEIRSLELATQIYKQKVNVTRAEHLPSIAWMGNYMVTNPSVFNSFENKFKGMWNVGVMVQIPIWHWGEGIYKTRAAKAEARIAQYQLQDAREKIELQVNQAAFKVKEAGKKLVMSSKNMEKAEENTNLKFDHNQINFLTVARLVEQKGIDRLIRIHRELIANHFNNKFYIIGDGPKREKLEKLIKDEHLQETFFLLGAKENPYPYIKQADMFCLLSKFEGYGMVLEEAKILNKPIIITNTAAREAVENYKNAVIVENDEHEIYNKLKYIIENNTKTFDDKKQIYDNHHIVKELEKLLKEE